MNGVAQHSPLVATFPLIDTAKSNNSPASSSIVSPTDEVAARHGRAPSTIFARGRKQGQNLAVMNPSPKKATATSSVQRTAHPRANIFPGSAVRGRMSIFSAEERPGRFQREFVEIDELGRGEFGRVMKARYESGSQEVFAVKKSKRFEGIKHRYVTRVLRFSDLTDFQ